MDRKNLVKDSSDNSFREMFNIPPESDLKAFGPLRMALTLLVALGGACAGLAAINFFIAG